MKHLSILLTLLLLLSLSLAACKAESSAPETQAAAETTPAASEAVTENQLIPFQVTLPEGMTRVISSETSDTLILDNTVVGGILVLDVSRECVEDPASSGELEYYLHNTVMPQIDPREGYDYMLSWGSLSYEAAHATFATEDRIEYSHHICLGESAVYDLWVNRSLVDSDTENTMATSVTIAQ